MTFCMIMSFIISTIKFNTTYKFLDGISSGGCVANAILQHRTFCVLPGHGQRAGGRIIHPQVPGAAAGHCDQKRREILSKSCFWKTRGSFSRNWAICVQSVPLWITTDIINNHTKLTHASESSVVLYHGKSVCDHFFAEMFWHKCRVLQWHSLVKPCDGAEIKYCVRIGGNSSRIGHQTFWW